MLRIKRHSEMILLSALAVLLLLLSLVFIVTSISFQTWFDIFGILKTMQMGTSIFLNIVESAVSIFTKYAHLYFPLAAVGMWRWSVWIFKRICAHRYKPIDVGLLHIYSTLSIITPVYNENHIILRSALNSWQSNNPDELIVRN